MFRFQKAVGVGSGNQDGGAFDARFLSCQIIQHLDFKMMSLAPAGIHPVEHLHPILRFGAACTCVEGKDGIVLVKLAGQQRRQLFFLDALGNLL